MYLQARILRDFAKGKLDKQGKKGHFPDRAKTFSRFHTDVSQKKKNWAPFSLREQPPCIRLIL